MINVAVLTGGYTDESVISMRSGELVFANLDTTKYNPIRVRILKEGWYAEIDGEKYLISREDFSFTQFGEKINFAVVYNTIHGTPGEDGYMQAYFQLIGLPFTGCDFYQAALTFNKRDCISVLSKYGIPHAKSVYLNSDDQINTEDLLAEVGLPCMVKPNKSGSSLGISKVNNIGDFPLALANAFKEDNEILVESYLNGTEVSVGVLNYKGEVKVLGITEIVSFNDFFDYEAKYEGKSEEITPARIDEKVKNKIEEISIEAYKKLNMTGFSRSEFIVVDNIPYFLEMNTLPGLSPASIFPQQAKIANIELKDLFGNEIEFALKRPKTWRE